MISNYLVKWFTDRKSVVQIIKSGSRKAELQVQALEIFNTCLSRRVSIEMEWIPRTENEQADTISKIQNPDDWELSFKIFYEIERRWGSHTIDRFANFRNTKLARFNSLSWNPGSKKRRCLCIGLAWRERLSSVFLIPRVLRHMMNYQEFGTVIVPFWPGAIFWPLLMKNPTDYNQFV